MATSSGAVDVLVGSRNGGFADGTWAAANFLQPYGVTVSPAVDASLVFVAKEVERDASILKQVRKAREERRMAKTGGNNANK